MNNFFVKNQQVAELISVTPPIPFEKKWEEVNFSVADTGEWKPSWEFTQDGWKISTHLSRKELKNKGIIVSSINQKFF